MDNSLRARRKTSPVKYIKRNRLDSCGPPPVVGAASFLVRSDEFECSHQANVPQRRKVETDFYGNKYVSMDELVRNAKEKVIAGAEELGRRSYKVALGTIANFFSHPRYKDMIECEELFYECCDLMELDYCCASQSKVVDGVFLYAYEVEFFSGSFYWVGTTGEFLPRRNAAKEVAFALACVKLFEELRYELKSRLVDKYHVVEKNENCKSFIETKKKESNQWSETAADIVKSPKLFIAADPWNMACGQLYPHQIQDRSYPELELRSQTMFNEPAQIMLTSTNTAPPATSGSNIYSTVETAVALEHEELRCRDDLSSMRMPKDREDSVLVDGPNLNSAQKTSSCADDLDKVNIEEAGEPELYTVEDSSSCEQATNTFNIQKSEKSNSTIPENARGNEQVSDTGNQEKSKNLSRKSNNALDAICTNYDDTDEEPSQSSKQAIDYCILNHESIQIPFYGFLNFENNFCNSTTVPRLPSIQKPVQFPSSSSDHREQSNSNKTQFSTQNQVIPEQRKVECHSASGRHEEGQFSASAPPPRKQMWNSFSNTNINNHCRSVSPHPRLTFKPLRSQHFGHTLLQGLNSIHTPRRLPLRQHWKHPRDTNQEFSNHHQNFSPQNEFNYNNSKNFNCGPQPKVFNECYHDRVKFSTSSMSFSEFIKSQKLSFS